MNPAPLSSPMLSSLPRVPIFSPKYQQSFNSLLDTLQRNNLDSEIFLVSDFDHTLTTMHSQQCHDIIGKNEALSEEFRDEFDSLCRNMPEGTTHARWWQVAHEKIVQSSGLTYDIFLQSLDVSSMTLRDGVKELLMFCEDSKLRTVITSAGIVNVIERTFESHGISITQNNYFYIDANKMEFREDNGNLLRIVPEIPLHPQVKCKMPYRAAHIFDDFHGQALSSDRKKCVVAVILGDRELDFDILREHENFVTVRFCIGFASTLERANELIASECCDVVLIGKDHNVYPVIELLKFLRSKESTKKNSAYVQRAEKWNRYYTNSIIFGAPPPWESEEAFSDLKAWIEGECNHDESCDSRNSSKRQFSAIELGCGSSASAIWLANCGRNFVVSAVDISALAIARAKTRPGADAVRWIEADLLDPALLDPQSLQIAPGVQHQEQRQQQKENRDLVIKIEESFSCNVKEADRTAVNTCLPAVAGPAEAGSVSRRVEDHNVAAISSVMIQTQVAVEEVETADRDQGGESGLVASGAAPLQRGSFDIVFDMQCFHVLRQEDESGAASVVADLLRPGGRAMVVTGAAEDEEGEGEQEVDQEDSCSSSSSSSKSDGVAGGLVSGRGGEDVQLSAGSCGEGSTGDGAPQAVSSLAEGAFAPHMVAAAAAATSTVAAATSTTGEGAGVASALRGPPTLRRSDVVDPFLRAGLELDRIWLSRFNPTPSYTQMGPQPPRAWVAIFRKPTKV